MYVARASGLVRYVTSPSRCNTGTETRLSLPADAPVHLCRLPNNFVRRVSAPGQCLPGEAPLTLPGTGPSFFCAVPVVTFLRSVMAPSQCASTETALVVSVPVATGDVFSVNEDGSLFRRTSRVRR